MPGNNNLLERSLITTKVLSLISILIAVFNLVTWFFFASAPRMQSTTALGILLSGGAILYLPRKSLLINIIGSAVFVLGFLILAEHYLGLNLSFSGQFRLVAPQSAVNFLFLGLALTLYNLAKPSVRFGQIFCVLVFANAVLNLTGYIFSTELSFGFPVIERPTVMAIDAALAFILLGGALLFTRPSEGIMSLITSETSSGYTARHILLTGILVPPIVGLLTKIGVIFNWYEVNTQVALFTVLLLGLLFRATWRAASQAKEEEIKGQEALMEAEIANENLRNSLDERQIFEALIRNSSDFIATIDVNGKPSYINAAGRRMIGLDSGISLEETTFTDYFPANEREFAENVIFKNVVEKDYWHGETYLRHWKTEEKIPVSADHFMIHEPQTGRLLGMGTITRDITRNKNFENLLKFLAEAGATLSSTLGYENTLKSVGELSVRELADICVLEIFDEDGKFTRYVTAADDKKEWIADIIMSRYPNRPFIETNETLFIEHTSLELQALSIKSAIAIPLLVHGKNLGIISYLSDGKTRTFGEVEVPMAEEFTRLSALSIRNAKLYREEQEASKMREDVLAVVSHDLKNPLSFIHLVAQMIQRSENPDKDKIKEFGTKIGKAAEQMQVLIHDLLDFAKLKSGTLSVEKRPVSFGEVIAMVIDQLKLQAENKKQTLTINLYPDLPEIDADPYRMAQILTNLLDNAIKFTPEGGEVMLWATKGEEGILVTVSDNGPGIEADQLPNIFEKFWQAKRTKHMGSGLGLAIVKGLIEAHNGKVWVESRVGKGASFSFSVPFAQEIRTSNQVTRYKPEDSSMFE
ncbi:MAG: ATP-binding protein [Bacteriovoracaceae bacterium]|nr:ATP-binding protein [Bacteriovoracaceae bacterium]